MSVGYNEIVQVLKNIYFAKDKRFDEAYLPMWLREINSISGLNLQALISAEKIIIREDIRLSVSDICDVLREQVQLNAPKLEYRKDVKCPYCKGKGYVTGLKFESNGKYTGNVVAISCCCGQKPILNSVTMKEDLSINHRTEVKDGYYLIFPSIVEEFEYLDKVYANDNWDIRRGNV